MLERTDRLALAVRDASVAAEQFRHIFDATVIDQTNDALSGSRRITLQWGRDLVELLEPTGDGPVADFLSSGRMGVFSGGFALADPGRLAARIERKGIPIHQDGDRYVVLPADLNGTGVILSAREERERVGLNDKIWQITYAAADLDAQLDFYTDLFGLEGVFTNRYHSDHFAYDGAITWFDARDGGVLDSLEYLDPSDDRAAVARFVKRNGSGIYMASIETDDIPAIKARVTETGDGWTNTDFGGFIHPKRIGGLLLGLVTYERWNRNRPLPAA